MGELWDIYDKNRNKTGRYAERGVYMFNEGEYHVVVSAVIINSKNEILISKRAPHKKHPLMWELCGGSILKDETSVQGMVREIREELGIVFDETEGMLLKVVQNDVVPGDFKDLWLFRKDVDIKDITFSDGEAIDAKWVSIDVFESMHDVGEIKADVDFDRADYEKAVEMLGKR